MLFLCLTDKINATVNYLYYQLSRIGNRPLFVYKMLRSVLNQHGTLFVLYIPKCPIQVCHTNVNAEECNDIEPNKTHGNTKESKTILARGVQDLQRSPLPARV